MPENMQGTMIDEKNYDKCAIFELREEEVKLRQVLTNNVYWR